MFPEREWPDFPTEMSRVEQEDGWLNVSHLERIGEARLWLADHEAAAKAEERD